MAPNRPRDSRNTIDNASSEHSSKRPADDSRKRTSNACNRCRQHKIKCTGSQPCAHCQKRGVTCTFDERARKVLVTRGWLSDHQGRTLARTESNVSYADTREDVATETSSDRPTMQENASEVLSTMAEPGAKQGLDTSTDDFEEVNGTEEPNMINPLVSEPAYYSPAVNDQSFWLGVSSNWSFGIRVLKLAHERVNGHAELPHSVLHFEGSSYDIGWDGTRASGDQQEDPILPPADFAMLLINAVKFHCGQLYYLFDEPSFMNQFQRFHENKPEAAAYDKLWFIHYLLVLAIGKGLIVQLNGKRLPGADLFVYAMKLLPHMIYLTSKPLQSAEVLCCAAIYLQCVEMRISAYNYIGQAMRLAITNGWHQAFSGNHFSGSVSERYRKVWWTIYTLDCYMSALQGTPATMDFSDIQTQLPVLEGHVQSLAAMRMHVELCRIMASTQQSVYTRHDQASDHFVTSIKSALRAIAGLNESREANFPLELEHTANGLSRVAAHLHLFHHQAIIFSTKPLLFFFFEKRLELMKPVRIPSSGGARALARTGIGSARQIIKILSALMAQDLLEAFLPFDLEALWIGILVLLLARVVDPSLSVDPDSSLQDAYKIIEEIANRGNKIAACRKAEMEYLDMTLQQLADITERALAVDQDASTTDDLQGLWHPSVLSESVGSDTAALHDFNFDNVLDAQQLEAIANSLNNDGFSWLTDIEQEINEPII